MSRFDESRLGDVAELVMGQSPDSSSYNEEGNGLPFLQGCSDFGKRHPDATVYCTRPTKVVKENYILISVRAPVGELNTSDKTYCIGRGVGAIKGRAASTEFLRYAIDLKKSELQRYAQGSTFDAINSADLADFKVQVPAIPEVQRKIAFILCTVDNLIEKTEALIEKYQSIKQGMMHDLFTRGVTENGELRPPFEEAPHLYKQSDLGWIPREWEVKRLGEVCERVSVGIATSTTQHFRNDGVPILRNQNIREDGIDLNDLLYISQAFSDLNKSKRLLPDDIITVRTGYPGLSCLVPQEMEGWHTFTTLISRPLPEQCGQKFLVLQLNSHLCKSQIARLQAGGAQQNLNAGWFVGLKLIMPLIDEQERIEKRVFKNQRLIEEEKKYLTKLCSLKHGLMQDLLTGKVPVKVEEQVPLNQD